MNEAQERNVVYTALAYKGRICGADQPLICRGDVALFTSACVHEHIYPIWLCARHEYLATAPGVRVDCAMCRLADPPNNHDDCPITFTAAQPSGSVPEQGG